MGRISTSKQITEHFGDKVITVRTTKQANHHGESAVEVIVGLQDGRTVTGTFTTQPKDSFGGIAFNQQKDIAGLMIAKVESILRGTAE